MEQKLRKTMQSIQQQFSFPEEVDIRTVLRKKKRSPKNKLVIFLITATCLFLFFMTDVPASVANLFGVSTAPRHPYNQYLVHNAHYYIPASENVSKEQLGRELGEVSRSGEWRFLQEGDTTEYVPGTKYYSIQGKATEEVIAVERIGGTVKKPVIEGYEVLKRAKPLEKVDVKQIFGGKNDSKEVQAAYDNIREVVPFLKVLQSPDVEMTFITLRNDGAHYYTKMMYRPTAESKIRQTIMLPFKSTSHEVEKTIFIQEYQEEFGRGKKEFEHFTSGGDFQYDSNKKVSTFSSNGLEWSEYKPAYVEENSRRFENYDHTYRAKTNGVIYEVSSQGCSIAEIKQLLETFLQARS
ncbi:hypothetical protein V7024_02860 [Bacillus sp. JJ864]|uniref:hypothetical protein n=1 Tax=Bacillus sp. JJ864 TaxID=3122975 RepID=UPI002FFEEB8C